MGTSLVDNSLFIQEINSLWNIRPVTIKKCTTPFKFAIPSKQILAWALAIAEKDPALIATAMRSVFVETEKEEGMVYVSRGNISHDVRLKLIGAAREEAAIQLQVNGLHIKDTHVATFVSSFSDRMKAIHPFGFELISSLWVTGGGHIYNEHVDVGDHVLIQVKGKKIVKFRQPLEIFDAEIIYNHNFRDERKRFDGPPVIVELNPGDAVFFSPGVLHEVSVPEGQQSVSLTVAANSAYPILNISNELHQLCTQENQVPFALKEPFAHWDKFRSQYFDPTRFSKFSQPHENKPRLLLDALQHMFIADSPTEVSRLVKMLDQWWSTFKSEKKYSPSGSLAPQPANREELLKVWEAERLRQDTK